MKTSPIYFAPPTDDSFWEDPTRPFMGEEEFWAATTDRFRLAEFRFGLDHMSDWQEFSFGKFNSAVKPIDLLGLPVDTPEIRAREIRATVAEAKAREATNRKAWRQRVAATAGRSDAPRILRVAERARLRALEIELVSVVVLVLSYGLRASRDPEPLRETCVLPRHSVLSDLLDIPPTKVAQLLQEKGRLVGSGLVRFEKRLISQFERELRMDPGTVQLLRGIEMPENLVAQLDEGLALDVLLDEPAMAGMRAWIQPGDSTALEEVPSSGTEPEDAGAEEVERGDLADPDWIAPYGDDLEYIEDQLNWIIAHVLSRKIEEDGMSVSDGPHRERIISRSDEDGKQRSALAQVRLLRARIQRRLRRTQAVRGSLPTAEAISRDLGLSQFEHKALLTVLGIRVSSRFQARLELGQFGAPRTSIAVTELIGMFTDEFKEECQAARYFRPEAPLIEHGLIELDSALGDVRDAQVSMSDPTADRLKGEGGNSFWLTDGAFVVEPKVDFAKVVLPEADKALLAAVATSFEAFKKHRGAAGLDDISGVGRGVIFQFFGDPGTGKTCMAHAIAKLRKRMLVLINTPKIEAGHFRAILREARQRGADVLFDECDEILKERGQNPATASLLSELERHDGLVMLATNRPLALDPAVYRRNLVSIEFRRPDAASRERIWEVHLPDTYPLAHRPDLGALAVRFDLTGGEIRNAVLLALSMATSRDSEEPLVTLEDLEKAAERQIQGRLRRLATATDSLPEIRLSDLVLPEATRDRLDQFIGSCRSTGLLAKWGLPAGTAHGGGARSAVFEGPPGTGKTSAAEGVAAELGRPLRRVSAAQVISRYVGESASRIEELFAGEGSSNSVLLLDDGDALLSRRTEVSSSTDRYANLDITTLLAALDRYQGILIVTTNRLEDIDPAILRRLEWKVPFPRLAAEDRARLWDRLLPPELPRTDDVDPARLARQWILSPAEMARVVRRAAEQAALRPEEERRVSMADLMLWAERIRDEVGGRAELGFGVG